MKQIGAAAREILIFVVVRLLRTQHPIFEKAKKIKTTNLAGPIPYDVPLFL